MSEYLACVNQLHDVNITFQCNTMCTSIHSTLTTDLRSVSPDQPAVVSVELLQLSTKHSPAPIGWPHPGIEEDRKSFNTLTTDL